MVNKIAIVGTVGIPASYGGFETLAENLVRFSSKRGTSSKLLVYCSAKSYSVRPVDYLGAELRYIPINANGVWSIFYDIFSLLSAVRHGCDVVLVLGVSGAIIFPLIRALTSVRIVTNVDGIEWRRDKWRGLARWFLRFSEKIAVTYSHSVIADNGGIANYIENEYGSVCHVIAYGGDHALAADERPYDDITLEKYALAVCRIEPENNVEMILSAFSRIPNLPLVFVGNWNNSEFGCRMREEYGGFGHLYLVDPIYDVGVLKALRAKAFLYVHGHSAGGTNPSLVEVMHFSIPVFAYDCVFNRFSTEDEAFFFKGADDLVDSIQLLDEGVARKVGSAMGRIAREKYTWDAIGEDYWTLIS